MIPVRLSNRLGITFPMVQAPMAGAGGVELAIEACLGGALASLPCGMLDSDAASTAINTYRQSTDRPLNLNFLCHDVEPANKDMLSSWLSLLGPYYREMGVEAPSMSLEPSRRPFGEDQCQLVEKYQPEVVSFHYGLPAIDLLERVKNSGATVLSSATTVSEARWLEQHGCDVIIAQGAEAGGHRGMFLDSDIAMQVGTMALVPQIVDAVSVPVIAAGGIADGRGIAAAFALGADAVQVGTAFLKTPESTISDLHRSLLAGERAEQTALTNLFSGGPARGIVNRLMRELGPMSDAAPPFPWAGSALAPLKAAPNGDFISLWSGQAARLASDCSARDLVERLMRDAEQVIADLNPSV